MMHVVDGLVSIIVPSHNSEKTITAALNSVLLQKYEKWELLIIDDGSTDETPHIIDDFSKRDLRIRTFHLPKSGVCAARNVGLDNSNGQYIVFLDSDDELTEDSIGIRVSLLSDAEMGIANYAKTLDTELLLCKESRWNKNATLNNLISGIDWGYQGYLWNKIFLNRIIQTNRIRFLDGLIFNEDRLFCFTYAQQINAVNLTNEIVYKYNQNSNSITEKLFAFTDEDFDAFITEFSAFDEMKRVNDDFAEKIDWQVYYRAFVLRQNIDIKSKKIHGYLKHLIRRTGFRLIFSKNTKFINRLILVKRIIILKPGLIQ